MTKKKPDIIGLIFELEGKKDRLEREARDYRDLMYETQGAADEIQCLMWKLEEMK